jgi:hypothetical protein
MLEIGRKVRHLRLGWAGTVTAVIRFPHGVEVCVEFEGGNWDWCTDEQVALIPG